MNDDTLREQMNQMAQGISTPFDMSEMLSYAIWGAVVTATRAFEKVTLRVDTNTNRIFVSIRLRWWAKFDKFKRIQDAWLLRAEERCKPHVPENFKLLIYYDRSGK
jgi:hypothetical protein